ncbi:proline rich transmembrane protein 1B-like [Ambystoma mexicanum]|uniref:proline rich transmembrane protein 1B-like n=1 Tax=Ambystoma mexicanum TaxID=8296 RepID=UPI0037E7EFCC
MNNYAPSEEKPGPGMHGAGPMPVINSPSPYNPGYPHGGHHIAMPHQPTVLLAPIQAQEKDYLGYSIFTMLCCCLPIGIAALIYSVHTRDANHRGDFIVAHQNSRTALTLNNVALGLGIFIAIAWIAYVISVIVLYR